MRHPNWSAIGKAVWDGQRALDVLCTLAEVDPNRLGAVGHSLGGHGSFFVAAFDLRVKAVVSSCGLTTWAQNPKRTNWTRDAWYCYIPQLQKVFAENQDPPFDLHEFAALVAPRAFLNISGMGDATYGNNNTLPEVGLQLANLYEMLDEGERFANFLFGGGHDIPEYSRALTVAWLERWLAQD
jgi:pimeloyl-ACP methyl ester carboxylesterase